MDRLLVYTHTHSTCTYTHAHTHTCTYTSTWHTHTCTYTFEAVTSIVNTVDPKTTVTTSLPTCPTLAPATLPTSLLPASTYALIITNAAAIQAVDLALCVEVHSKSVISSCTRGRARSAKVCCHEVQSGRLRAPTTTPRQCSRLGRIAFMVQSS